MWVASWLRIASAPLIGALAAAQAGAAPLLSEVFYDAVGSDNGLSFVEIWGTPGFVLDGVLVEGVNGGDGQISPSIALSGAIPGDGIFVLADESSAGATFVANADLVRNFDFQNGADSIVLRGPTGVLDAVGYGVFAPGEAFAGEGTAAIDPAAGESLARAFANVDTQDNAADWVALAAPTPGQAALATIPEPGTALLLALGLGGIARRRARAA